jgi:hypothetical protein
MASGTKPTKYCKTCVKEKINAARAKAPELPNMEDVNSALQLSNGDSALLMSHATKVVDFFAAQDEVVREIKFVYEPHGDGSQILRRVEAVTVKHRQYA